MTRQESMAFARDTVKTLLKISESTDAQEFKAFLMGGILANVLGNIPESTWQEFVKCEPCDQPNCDCHIMAAKHGALLQEMRDDFKKHGPVNN